METRPTLRSGMPGTRKLAARYGERLVCVRYLYDQTRGRRLRTVEPVVEEALWHGRSRKPRRHDHDLVAVRIAWDETDLRIAVKKAGGIWRPRQKLWEMTREAVRTLGIGHRVVGELPRGVTRPIYNGIWDSIPMYGCVCRYMDLGWSA